MSTTPATSPEGQEPATGEAPPTEGKKPTDAQDAAKRDGMKELPSWAQDEIKLAREQAAQARVDKKATEARLKTMEEQRLADEEKWRELAETRAAELDTLRPKSELADKLSTLLSEQLTNEIADWPDNVKALAPRSGDDPLALLEWVGNARSLVQEIKTPAPPPPTGNSGGPRPLSPDGTPPPVNPVVNVRSRF